MPETPPDLCSRLLERSLARHVPEAERQLFAAALAEIRRLREELASCPGDATEPDGSADRRDIAGPGSACGPANVVRVPATGQRDALIGIACGLLLGLLLASALTFWIVMFYEHVTGWPAD